MLDLFFFFEVGVAEDIGCGADEAEANLVHAGVAGWKVVVGNHHDFVGGAMFAVVYDFVDSGFTHGVSRTTELGVRCAFF